MKDISVMLKGVAFNPNPKYYLIGIWIVSKDYTPKGFLIDIIVSKGYGYEDAVENIRKYENSIRMIETEIYLPLTVGNTVFEATKNFKNFYDLIHTNEVMPDNEIIQEAYNKVLVMEGEKNG